MAKQKDKDARLDTDVENAADDEMTEAIPEEANEIIDDERKDDIQLPVATQEDTGNKSISGKKVIYEVLLPLKYAGQRVAVGEKIELDLSQDEIKSLVSLNTIKRC